MSCNNFNESLTINDANIIAELLDIPRDSVLRHTNNNSLETEINIDVCIDELHVKKSSTTNVIDLAKIDLAIQNLQLRKFVFLNSKINNQNKNLYIVEDLQ